MASTSKVVILTGASRGIGLATAHYLLKQGHKIVAVARSKEPLDQLASEYKDQVEPLTGDLADFSLAKKAVDAASSRWGQVDGLIINHGVLAPVKRVSNVTAEEWRECFNINSFSAVALVQAAIPNLRKTKGSIVLVSSGAAAGAYATWGAYGASKAVLNHLAMTLAVEEPEITTISLRPGVVDTEMQRELREVHHEVMDKKDADKFAGLKASGGLVRPEQPGHVMAKLAVHGPKDLSGKFLNWNDEKLSAYQEA